MMQSLIYTKVLNDVGLRDETANPTYKSAIIYDGNIKQRVSCVFL